jgi:hypothetical protein
MSAPETSFKANKIIQELLGMAVANSNLGGQSYYQSWNLTFLLFCLKRGSQVLQNPHSPIKFSGFYKYEALLKPSNAEKKLMSILEELEALNPQLCGRLLNSSERYPDRDISSIASRVEAMELWDQGLPDDLFFEILIEFAYTSPVDVFYGRVGHDDDPYFRSLIKGLVQQTEIQSCIILGMKQGLVAVELMSQSGLDGKGGRVVFVDGLPVNRVVSFCCVYAGINDFAIVPDVNELIGMTNKMEADLILSVDRISLKPNSDPEFLYMEDQLSRLVGLLSHRGVLLYLGSFERLANPLPSELKSYMNLVMKGLVDGVIDLPRMQNSARGSKLTLITLRNGRNPDSLIFYYNNIVASSMMGNEKRTHEDQWLQMTESIITKDVNDNKFTLVTVDEVLQSGMPFDPRRFSWFFLDLERYLKEGKGAYFDELLIVISGAVPLTHKEQRNLPVITGADLKIKVADRELDLEALKLVAGNSQKRGAVIRQSCVLIARTGLDLKPTIIRPKHDGNGVIISDNVIALIPKSRLDLDFLYFYLYDDFVQNQISYLANHSATSSLSVGELKKLILPAASEDEQKKYVRQNVANLRARIKHEKDTELSNLDPMNVFDESERLALRMLAHQIRPEIYALSRNLGKLRRFVDQRGVLDEPILPKKVVTTLSAKKETNQHRPDKKPISVGGVLNELLASTKHLEANLNSIERIVNLELDWDSLEKLQVDELFKGIIGEREQKYANHYGIVCSIPPGIEWNCSRELMTLLVDLLLENAKEHAFEDQMDPANNTASFYVATARDEEGLELVYRNNGSPLAIPKDAYFRIASKRRGSHGSGLGGNLIWRITHLLNGNCDILDDPTGFSIKFSFKPLIKKS